MEGATGKFMTSGAERCSLFGMQFTDPDMSFAPRDDSAK
jgi:hypothetical protein